MSEEKESPVIPLWKVIVSNNIGIVYEGDDEKQARKTYKKYVAKSSMGFGQVGHEKVVLLNGEDEKEKYEWKKGSTPLTFDDEEIEEAVVSSNG